MTETLVRGEKFVLHPERALFWPRHGLLAIADLHLGKSETFQMHGMWLPSQAHLEDIARLDKLAAELDARHVLFLGDLVHTASGLTTELVDAFAAWMNGFEGVVTMAIGNHDVRLLKNWPRAWEKMRLVERWEADGFVFQHEPPTKSDGSFHWTGHIHPVVVLQQGPDRLRLPCFAIKESEGTIPAFSSVAGGFNMKRSRSQHLFAVGAGKVWEL